MQLEEQFDNLDDDIFCHAPDACAQIAENFAIGFAQWLKTNQDFEAKTTKELLEIYKKTL